MMDSSKASITLPFLVHFINLLMIQKRMNSTDIFLNMLTYYYLISDNFVMILFTLGFLEDKIESI